MRLHLVDRSNLENNSFRVSHNQYPHFLKIWHYHPELELVLILKSTGTRFIGDNIEKFESGEVVLIGENLPHLWLNDDKYFAEPSELKAEAIAIHFRKDFLGAPFLQVPELKQVLALIEKAKQGIKFIDFNADFIDKVKRLRFLYGFKKLILLFQILHDLTHCRNYKLLASNGYINNFTKANTRVLDSAYEYIFKNFNKSILLQDVASVANMNPTSFSRCFKRINRKTFTQYVNEIRIGYACRLLTEEKFNITRICYESGFQNVSNFNRQFKKIIGKSPTQYLQDLPISR